MASTNSESIAQANASLGNETVDVFYKLGRVRRVAIFAEMLARQWPMWVWCLAGMAGPLGVLMWKVGPYMGFDQFAVVDMILMLMSTGLLGLMCKAFVWLLGADGKRVAWEVVAASLISPSLALGPLLGLADGFSGLEAAKARVMAQVWKDKAEGSVEFEQSKVLLRELPIPLWITEIAVRNAERALGTKEVNPVEIFEQELDASARKAAGVPLMAWSVLIMVAQLGAVFAFFCIGAPFRIGWSRALMSAGRGLKKTARAAGQATYVMFALLPWKLAKWVAVKSWCAIKFAVALPLAAWAWGTGSLAGVGGSISKVARWSPRKWTAGWTASVVERGMSDPALRARIEAEAIGCEIGDGDEEGQGPARL